jgi:PPOX class probable F420-dependent enzyme
MAYQRMTDDDVRAFLTSDPPRPGVVATTRKDGRPHAAPVWYVVDDDGTIVFTTGADTVKGRTLRRTGWAAMTVDDDAPPFSFVTMEGPVALSDNVAQVREWAARIAGRYMGEHRADEYGDRNGVPGELLVRLTPQHTVSARNLAD